jgi:very-short-patch-repair endonuclease
LEGYESGRIVSPCIGIPRTQEDRDKMSKGQMGKTRSKESNEKRSKTLREGYQSGRLIPWVRTEKHNIENSKRGIKYLKNNKNKKINTKPERKVIGILKDNNIKYKFQYVIKCNNGKFKMYDFYLKNYNLLIEVDGTYWHSKGIKDRDIKNKNLLNIRKNDKIKTKLAKEKGFKLIRVWEDEIEKFERKIKKICN